MKRWLAIDPGVSCGIAFFIDDRLVYSTHYSARGNSWEKKTQDISRFVSGWHIYFQPHKIFIEFPTAHFRGNLISVLKLAFLIGRLVEVGSGGIELVPVSMWKKSLSKEVTHRRAEKYFSITGLKTDEGDAVALGKYCLEKNLV